VGRGTRRGIQADRARSPLMQRGDITAVRQAPHVGRSYSLLEQVQTSGLRLEAVNWRENFVALVIVGIQQ